MRVLVLGSAAGGGFPQWNSSAPACRRARRGDTAALPRTQASLAVSADGEHWLLLNASPDLRLQIEHTPALHPAPASPDVVRDSPVAAVLLTGGDVDAIGGLLHLREGHRFMIYATQPVLDILSANPIFDVLPAGRVPRRTLTLDQTMPLAGPKGPLALTVEAFAVPGKVPLYLESGSVDDTPVEDGHSIGVILRSAESGRGFAFVPGCAAITSGLRERLAGQQVLFFDGTLWRDDELIALGAGSKTGRRMGHVSMSGADGAIAGLADCDIGRRIFIHINNSNPALLADSRERQMARRAGWEIAYDGMELRL